MYNVDGNVSFEKTVGGYRVSFYDQGTFYSVWSPTSDMFLGFKQTPVVRKMGKNQQLQEKIDNLKTENAVLAEKQNHNSAEIAKYQRMQTGEPEVNS